MAYYSPLWRGKTKKSDVVFISIVSVLTLLFLFYTILTTFVFTKILVSGISMENTLHDGDGLYLNSHVEPQYGDIIVVDETQYWNEWFIKRLIGKPGDIIIIKNGYVYRGGNTEEYRLQEDYAVGVTETSEGKNIWVLQENEYFFLGDNREHSQDARYHIPGVCTRQQIIGVICPWSLKLKEFRGWLFKLSLDIRKAID